jgi:hypothetical protein
VESDWMCYHGSCEELQADVSKFGEENFERVILRLCDSLAECTYFEAKYQFENDVILKPDEYYNSWISCRCRSNHLKKLIGNMEYEKMLCI